MNNKLFVGGISFNTTENNLQDAFAAHGTVNEVNVITDRMTGKSKGFGFVTMSTEQEAQSAIEAMNAAKFGFVRRGEEEHRSQERARPRGHRSGPGFSNT